MATVKAHITLDERAADDESRRKDVLDEIVRVARMTGINHQRFEKYGILTGEVDESRLDAIRGVDGVASVDVDKTRGLRS